MEIIAELFIAIATFVVGLILHLFTAVFTLMGLSVMSRGTQRVLFGIGAVAGIYLVGVLFLPMFPAFSWVAGSVFTRFWVLFTAFIIMLLSFFTPFASAKASDEGQTPNSDRPPMPSWLFDLSTRGMAILALFLLIGAISVSGTTYKRHKTLRERACDAVHAQIDKRATDQKEFLAGLADRFLSPDIRAKFPCQRTPGE
ncbi:MAG: hypothetical protein ACPGRD_08970 [Planktomarina sp.]